MPKIKQKETKIGGPMMMMIILSIVVSQNQIKVGKAF